MLNQLLLSLILLFSLVAAPLWRHLHIPETLDLIAVGEEATTTLTLLPITPFVPKQGVAVVPDPAKAPAENLKTALTPRVLQLEERIKEAALAPIPIAPPAPVLALPSASQIYEALDGAVVQILCKIRDDYFISGSGFVVSEHGIVLTNVHVVENGTNCQVRTGNPAVYAGDMEVVFIGNTVEVIPDTKVPRQDFAFGKITRRIHSKFSDPFKFLKLNTAYAPLLGDGFFVAAYSSEFLGNSIVHKNAQNLVFSTTELLGSFAVDYSAYPLEIIELSGNISTQEGASGSPVISPRDGSVIALVFGQSKDDAARMTSSRTEFAFLISYIDKVLRITKGRGILELVEDLGQ